MNLNSFSKEVIMKKNSKTILLSIIFLLTPVMIFAEWSIETKEDIMTGDAIYNLFGIAEMSQNTFSSPVLMISKEPSTNLDRVFIYWGNGVDWASDVELKFGQRDLILWKIIPILDYYIKIISEPERLISLLLDLTPSEKFIARTVSDGGTLIIARWDMSNFKKMYDEYNEHYNK